GTPTDNCTLELEITGPINPRDPNPHHHLFVCYKGGTPCAGPNPGNALSFTELPSLGTLLAGGFFETLTSGGHLPTIFAARITNPNVDQSYRFINLLSVIP